VHEDVLQAHQRRLVDWNRTADDDADDDADEELR
jgi:hypothetical protein